MNLWIKFSQNCVSNLLFNCTVYKLNTYNELPLCSVTLCEFLKEFCFIAFLINFAFSVIKLLLCCHVWTGSCQLTPRNVFFVTLFNDDFSWFTGERASWNTSHTWAEQYRQHQPLYPFSFPSHWRKQNQTGRFLLWTIANCLDSLTLEQTRNKRGNSEKWSTLIVPLCESCP